MNEYLDPDYLNALLQQSIAHAPQLNWRLGDTSECDFVVFAHAGLNFPELYTDLVLPFDAMHRPSEWIICRETGAIGIRK